MIPLSAIKPYLDESDLLQIRHAEWVQVRVQGATASRQFLGVLSENSPSLHAAGRVHMPFDNLYGCRPYPPHALDDQIAVVWRGQCTFDEKVAAAYASGAKAIVFINNEQGAEEDIAFRALVSPGSPLLSVSITPYDGIMDVEGEWHVLQMIPEPGPPVLHLQGAPIHNIALLRDIIP
ncbi:hypothetical protein BCR43DRAFT_121358 [Syncephalastrum racemosum]|uniref:PA domain-containing protein n=1 Tax=Syncephalastrum racemosum TaxID=13706 RepID=A0A1X2GZT0_SYNRA|nr:hypothetical protein BCR43DRAFT_121358 [Syncephalastrum racemosum]